MPAYDLPPPLDAQKALDIIAHKVTMTPMKTSTHLNRLATVNARQTHGDSSMPAIQLFLKCENLQKTGSFKYRGATHFLAKLQDQELANGVVAYSTGNHAQAVAQAARVASLERNMHIPAYVVVPTDCPATKQDAARSYGAKVLHAGDAAGRVGLATEISESTGAILIPPADHVDIVLGQATAVRELLQQVADVGQALDAIVVPSGGGGLLVGAVVVCASQNVAVFGAEPEVGGPGLASALRIGCRESIVKGRPSIADGLRTTTGEANWEHIRHEKNVQGVFSVSEEQIKEALKLVVEELQMLIEPSAAVGVAAALFSQRFVKSMAQFKDCARVGVVLTGGNISETDLLEPIPDLQMNGILQK